MYSRSPRVGDAFPLLPGVPCHGKPQRAHDCYVGRYVPLPERGSRAPQRSCQPGLVFLQCNFSPLALVDLEADARHARRLSVAAVLDAPAPLKQPQPACLIDEYTIFELESIKPPEAYGSAFALTLGEVIGVNLPRPTLEVIRARAGIEPDGRAPKWIYRKDAGAKVPLPGTDLSLGRIVGGDRGGTSRRYHS